jgi:hypothetical protein
VDSPKSPVKEKISLRHPLRPLKDIKTALSSFRRMGHKEKDEPTGWGTAGVGVHADRPRQRIDEDWFRSPMDPPPLLDRMGDAEMTQEEDEVRTGGILWLASLPDGTRHGDWMTAWASITPTYLTVAYVPVLSGGSYNGARPVPRRVDEELVMRSCVDVRPLPVDEIPSHRLPPLPQSGDIIMLEFTHGARRYMAVDYTSSRSWIDALSDVLLTAGAFSPSLKSYHEGSLRLGQLEDIAKFGDTWVASSSEPSSWHTAGGSSPRTLPHQPSPVRSQNTGLSAAALESMAEEADVPPTPPPKSRPRSTLIADRMAAFSPELKPTPPLKLHRMRKESGTTQRTQDSATTQTQHPTSAGATVGVRSQPTGSSNSNPLPKERDTPRGARPGGTGTPLRAASLQQIDPLGTSIADRIRSWQPKDNTPPPRTVSRRESIKSQYSFDTSDLNPSRSASQVRPAKSVGALDLAALDAGLNRLPALKETNRFSPRSPARKAVPKYDEEVEQDTPKTEDSGKLPDPIPVPEPVTLAREPSTPKQRGLLSVPSELPKTVEKPEPPSLAKVEEPASPRPRRLNTRIAAAKERFEGSPKLDATPKSPAVKTHAMPKSPLLTAKSPAYSSKSPAIPSPLPGAKSPKAPSATTPIHAPVARPTTSAALLESAARSDVSSEKSATGVKDKDTLAPPNLAATLAPPKRPGSTASAGSTTSVRDRIEALRRAADSPVETTPKRAPAPISVKAKTPAKEDKASSTESNGIGRNYRSPPPRSPESVRFPQPSLRSAASSPTTFRTLASPPPTTAPLNVRNKYPLSTASTMKSKRTLLVTNPDPESPELPNAQLRGGSEVSGASQPQESITGLLADYGVGTYQDSRKGKDKVKPDQKTEQEKADEDAKREEAHAAEVEAREAAPEAERADKGKGKARAVVLADMPSAATGPDADLAEASVMNDPSDFARDAVLTALHANHTTVSDQLNILNADLGAITSLLNESAGHHTSVAADTQHRLVVLDEGLRLVHAAVPPDLAAQLAKIQEQLDEVVAGIAAGVALGASVPAVAGEEGPRDTATEVGADKALPPPPEAADSDPANPEEPAARSASAAPDGPVARFAPTPAPVLAPVVVSDAPAESGDPVEVGDKPADRALDAPADADKAAPALDPITGEPVPDPIQAKLDDVQDNINFLASQLADLKMTQATVLAAAAAAGAQQVMDKLQEMEGARAAEESKLVYAAEEKAKAAEKAAEEAKAEVEKAKAETEKAKAEAAEKAKAAEVTETKDAPKDEPKDEAKDAPADKPAEEANDEKKEDAPPPPPPATAEQIEALTAQLNKLSEDQVKSQENQASIGECENPAVSQLTADLGKLNEYIVTIIGCQDKRYDEAAARDATVLEAINSVPAAAEAAMTKSKDEYLEALRGLGMDLQSSINGERLNFIEAMRNATSQNMQSECSPPLPAPLTPDHAREFLSSIQDDVAKSQAAMQELHEYRNRAQSDILEMMDFLVKHAKKSGMPVEQFPPNLQEALKKAADGLANGLPASSPQPPRPLPLPPAA